MRKLFILVTIFGLITFNSCTPEELLQPEDYAIDQENVPGSDPEEDPEDDS